MGHISELSLRTKQYNPFSIIGEEVARLLRACYSTAGHGNAADREAHEVVTIAEGAARHPSDARLAEEREDIFAGLELAPVIDCAAVVQVDPARRGRAAGSAAEAGR